MESVRIISEGEMAVELADEFWSEVAVVAACLVIPCVVHICLMLSAATGSKICREKNMAFQMYELMIWALTGGFELQEICGVRGKENLAETSQATESSTQLSCEEPSEDRTCKLKDKDDMGKSFIAILESYGALGAESGAWASPGASTVCPQGEDEEDEFPWSVCSEDDSSDDELCTFHADASFKALLGSDARPSLEAMACNGGSFDRASVVDPCMELLESYGALGAQSGAWTSSSVSTTVCPADEAYEDEDYEADDESEESQESNDCHPEQSVPATQLPSSAFRKSAYEILECYGAFGVQSGVWSSPVAAQDPADSELLPAPLCLDDDDIEKSWDSIPMLFESYGALEWA